MIALYMKNRPWSGHPRCDYVRVISEEPLEVCGYRIDGGRLAEESAPNGYLAKFAGWYHPATSWEIEEYKRLGGRI